MYRTLADQGFINRVRIFDFAKLECLSPKELSLYAEFDQENQSHFFSATPDMVDEEFLRVAESASLYKSPEFNISYSESQMGAF